MSYSSGVPPASDISYPGKQLLVLSCSVVKSGMAFKRFFNINEHERFKIKKEESLKRGRLNFKDGEDVKCVLHKFPFLESSETSKIIPKSNFYLYIIRIT